MNQKNSQNTRKARKKSQNIEKHKKICTVKLRDTEATPLQKN